jgi:hypothetical protein
MELLKMTISINITDIHELTEKDIKQLNEYLMNAAGITTPTVATASKTPTTRKKQAAEPAPSVPTGTVGQVLSVDTLTWVTPEPPTPPTPPQSITYEELIAFVLENTREKRLDFDKVMSLVAEFDIPNINALSGYPELVNPFFKRLKETIHG